MTDYLARVDALSQTWQEWARIGAELTEHEWHRPTRCEPWEVVHVYAHHSVFPRVFAAPPPGVPAGAIPTTAVGVLRGFNAPGGVAHARAEEVSGRAMTASATHAVDELVARFASIGPQAIDALRTADPGRLLPWTDYVITLAEALRIGVMEAAVHLLDVQRALERTPRVPEPALEQTRTLLAELAPPIEFIESATGRTAAAPPLPVIR